MKAKKTPKNELNNSNSRLKVDKVINEIRTLRNRLSEMSPASRSGDDKVKYTTNSRTGSRKQLELDFDNIPSESDSDRSSGSESIINSSTGRNVSIRSNSSQQGEASFGFTEPGSGC